MFVQHHLAHATSSFYASGFSHAEALVIDGSGEFEAISIYEARRDDGLKLRRSWPRSFSVGTLYAAVTRVLRLGYLGEGKTMGLAAYRVSMEDPVLPADIPRAPP